MAEFDDSQGERPPKPGGSGTGPLAQRLSEEFINAQNSIERTVQELRQRCRALNERMHRTLRELEINHSGANVDLLAGFSEDSQSVERLGRLLVDQRELLETAIDNTRAVTRSRLR